MHSKWKSILFYSLYSINYTKILIIATSVPYRSHGSYMVKRVAIIETI